jgi:hypothetical protein
MNENMEEVLLNGRKVGFIIELRDTFKSWKYAFVCKAETCKSFDVLINLGLLLNPQDLSTRRLI